MATNTTTTSSTDNCTTLTPELVAKAAKASCFISSVATEQGYVEDPEGNLKPTWDKLTELFGWVIIGDFATGATIDARSQMMQDASGDTWRYTGALPVTVAAGTTPSAPDWIREDVSPNKERINELTGHYCVDDKAGALALGVVQEGDTLDINSSDGGYTWKFVSSSNYSDTGNEFCGVFISVGGGAAGWERSFDNIYIEYWGFSELASGADNSASFQASVNFCIKNKIGSLYWKSGSYDLDKQIVVEPLSTASVDRYSLDLISEGVQESVLVSKVTGAIHDQETAGYLFNIDGMSHSKWSGFTINYVNDNSGMAGGIVASPVKQSLFKNDFSGIRFVGGSSLETRYTDIRRSIKIIGNRAISQTGLVAYFNRISDCSFNFAYKHIECISGDGSAGQSQPNATMVSGHCLFERYVNAIDFSDADECSVGSQVWFQQGQINSSYPSVINTYCVNTDGVYIELMFSTESGNGAKPYLLGQNCDHVVLSIVNNNALNGDILADSNKRIRDYSANGFNGIDAINFMDTGNDLNLFGRDGMSHDADKTRQLRIFRKNSSSDKAEIGFDDSTSRFKISVMNRDLDLRPANTGNNVIVAGSKWNDSLVRLGNFRLWIDTSGKLRMHSDQPTSDTDGVIVGTQS